MSNNKIQFKACPRCNGDMIVEEYLGESDLVCLQCGNRRPADQTRPMLSVVPAREQKHGRKAA